MKIQMLPNDNVWLFKHYKKKKEKKLIIYYIFLYYIIYFNGWLLKIKFFVVTPPSLRSWLARHQHHIPGVPAPWKMVQPKTRHAPPEIHLTHQEPLPGWHHKSQSIFAPVTIYLCQTGHQMVSLHPIYQPQEMLLRHRTFQEFMNFIRHPLQWLFIKLAHLLDAVGYGEHISKVKSPWVKLYVRLLRSTLSFRQQQCPF